MRIKVIYSYIYNRHLNYHRSKEQVQQRFNELEGSCEEFEELTDRFLLKCIEKMESYAGKQIPRESIRIFVVTRDRGGSFHEPLTLNYDEDQKFMFAELLHLVGHHLVDDKGAILEAKINLMVETVLKTLPLDFTRQMERLHKNQEHRFPVEYFRLDAVKYNITKKTIPELFPPVKKKEIKQPVYDYEYDE